VAFDDEAKGVLFGRAIQDDVLFDAAEGWRIDQRGALAKRPVITHGSFVVAHTLTFGIIAQWRHANAAHGRSHPHPVSQFQGEIRQDVAGRDAEFFTVGVILDGQILFQHDTMLAVVFRLFGDDIQPAGAVGELDNIAAKAFLIVMALDGFARPYLLGVEIGRHFELRPHDGFVAGIREGDFLSTDRQQPNDGHKSRKNGGKTKGE